MLDTSQKNIVASNLASKCEIGIAYAIGIEVPVGLSINTFGTGTVTEEDFRSYLSSI